MSKIWLELDLAATNERAAAVMSDILTDLIEIDEVIAIEGTVEGMEDDSEEHSIYD